jgi:PAS domain S-box-containing protein
MGAWLPAMKPKLFALLLLFSLSLWGRDILLLHSYHKGYAWSDAISTAIEEHFKGKNVDITTEYMDTKHIFDNDYIHTLLDFYQKRYRHRSYDLIIVSDNNALDFLNRFHDQIFQDTPIVFCGINNFSDQDFNALAIKDRTTGIVEQVDIEKNIKLIQTLHPNLSKLLVLNDTTTTGKHVKKAFFDAAEPFQRDGLVIDYVDRFAIDELQERIKFLDEKSIILFMLLFKDKTGKRFTFKDGLQAIEQSASVPIYGLWDFYLDHGLVGGYLTHGKAQGAAAAKLADRILQGTPVHTIKLITTSPNRYIFDYHKLKQFKIDPAQLPKDSLIKNRPFSIYEQYKKGITAIALLFMVFIVIIILLGIALQQKRRTKNQLQLKLRFIETLLNTINTPIFYKDKQGKYVGGNSAFCTFIGQPREEIIGKTMYDFFDGQDRFLELHKEIEHKLLDGQAVGEYTMEYLTPNGKLQTMLVKKSLYYDLEGNVDGILTILHDITELVEIEQEKKQNESFMVQQSKLAEIGEMISAIAHQWNEPLVEMSAIVQDLELQYKLSALSNEDIETFVHDSMVQIQYMSKTLKDFRDFLKPSVQKSHFRIQEAFDEVFNIMSRQIKYSYIDLSIRYESDALAVYGYKNEFMQVLITILNNARDAIAKVKQSHSTHKGTIDIVVTSQDGMIQIALSDNGCGIPDDKKIDVFQPYFSTKTKGNGLGLYMSKVLIEDKMNGQIFFEKDTPNTSLMIKLPIEHKAIRS